VCVTGVLFPCLSVWIFQKNLSSFCSFLAQISSHVLDESGVGTRVGVTDGVTDGATLTEGETDGASEGLVVHGHRQQVVVQISKATPNP
jgi:hypothetical protein